MSRRVAYAMVYAICALIIAQSVFVLGRDFRLWGERQTTMIYCTGPTSNVRCVSEPLR